MSQNKDRDLHVQIEDLLMALSDLQREQAELAQELQREREEREEDQELAKSMLSYIKGLEADSQPADIVAKAEERFLSTGSRRMSIVQTKHQLRDDATRWKEKYELEAARCADLGRRIDEFEHDKAQVKEELRETRARVQDGYRDKQRLERTILDLRNRITSYHESPDRSSAAQSEPGDVNSSRGLRELKLVRSNSQKITTSQKTTWNKRSSSLGLQSVLATENNKPAGEEALLLELINAKTAEALAKQELEEFKAKFDSLRKKIDNSRNSALRTNTGDGLPTIAVAAAADTKPPAEQSKPVSGGGFFSGWGRRTASTSNASYTESK
jgi:chromosome segregation ATPase